MHTKETEDDDLERRIIFGFADEDVLSLSLALCCWSSFSLCLSVCLMRRCDVPLRRQPDKKVSASISLLLLLGFASMFGFAVCIRYRLLFHLVFHWLWVARDEAIRDVAILILLQAKSFIAPPPSSSTACTSATRTSLFSRFVQAIFQITYIDSSSSLLLLFPSSRRISSFPFSIIIITIFTFVFSSFARSNSHSLSLSQSLSLLVCLCVSIFE